MGFPPWSIIPCFVQAPRFSMKRFDHHCLLFVGLVTSLMPVVALCQGTASDYQRAGQLPDTMREKVFRTSIRPHWFAENSRFWYRNDLADGAREFVIVDVATGERRPAFDHQRLAEALGETLQVSIKGTHLPLESITFDVGGNCVLFRAEDKS